MGESDLDYDPDQDDGGADDFRKGSDYSPDDGVDDEYEGEIDNATDGDDDEIVPRVVILEKQVAEIQSSLPITQVQFPFVGIGKDNGAAGWLEQIVNNGSILSMGTVGTFGSGRGSSSNTDTVNYVINTSTDSNYFAFIAIEDAAHTYFFRIPGGGSSGTTVKSVKPTSTLTLAGAQLPYGWYRGKEWNETSVLTNPGAGVYDETDLGSAGTDCYYVNLIEMGQATWDLLSTANTATLAMGFKRSQPFSDGLPVYEGPHWFPGCT